MEKIKKGITMGLFTFSGCLVGLGIGYLFGFLPDEEMFVITIVPIVITITVLGIIDGIIR